MKKQRGITLIALVITIIVLLVLAGVSLSLVLGDNGVIEKSQKATTATRNAEEKEKVEMAVAAARAAGNGVLTTENLNTELDNVFDNGKEVEETKARRLPAEYQEVEYIESTGTQFINTAVYPKSTTKVIFDFSCSEAGGGNGWGSAGNNEAFLWGNGNENFISFINSSWVSENTNINIDNSRHVFYLESGNQLFDGVKYGSTAIGNTATNNQYMYLCAEHWEWDNRAGNYSKRSRIFLQRKSL